MFSDTYKATDRSRLGKSVLTIATATSTLLAILWAGRFLKNQYFKKPQILEKDDLIGILKELSLEFHAIFFHLSKMHRRVTRALSEKGHDVSLETDKVNAILMTQGIEENMKTVQEEIAEKYRLPLSVIQNSQNFYKDDPEIIGIEIFFDQMFEDARQGLAPLFTGYPLEEDPLEPQFLESTCSKLHAKKMAVFKENLDLEALKGDDITGPLKLLSEHCETDFFHEMGMDKHVFRMHLTRVLRSNPEFAEKYLGLCTAQDQEFRDFFSVL